MARIEHCEFGRIVVDGQEERRDLIMLPDQKDGVAGSIPAGGSTSR